MTINAIISLNLLKMHGKMNLEYSGKRQKQNGLRYQKG